MSEGIRERVVRLIREMRERTTDRGATPAEAAGFAAKVAEWIERYQIEEEELLAKDGADGRAGTADIEVCQNTIRTGKKVFNPGATQVVNGLALGMCCKVILLNQHGEAVYGVVGDTLDADYVCQMATLLVPQLQTMARLEGAEHGYEKAGLIRWSNQYLTGAGQEILQRIEHDRKRRSDVKEIEHRRVGSSAPGTALMVVTGESIAVAKREATAQVFKEMYPKTRTSRSRSEYDHTANARGRAAGRAVGLNVAIEGGSQ